MIVDRDGNQRYMTGDEYLAERCSFLEKENERLNKELEIEKNKKNICFWVDGCKEGKWQITFKDGKLTIEEIKENE